MPLKKWIKKIIENHDKQCGDINVIFCSDSYLLQMNQQYLGHDYFTDIITFDYCEEKLVSGDLYISIDTVRANAIEYKQTFVNELRRVIIHGVLHLLGFNDHTDEDIAQMRKSENESLLLLETYL